MLASPTVSPSLPSLRPARWLLLPALVALGDRLFDDHAPGISLALFLAALAVTVPLANPIRRDARSLGTALTLLVLGLLPLVEEAGFLAILFGTGGLLAFAVIATGGLGSGWTAILAAMGRMLVAGPFQIGFDAAAGLHRPVATVRSWPAASVVGWVLPVGLTGLFGALFVSANPLIDAWLGDLPRLSLEPDVAPGRLFAWGLLAALAWPFVALRLRHRASKAPPAPAPARIEALHPAVIGRCLVLFNLLFAVQSGLAIASLFSRAITRPIHALVARSHAIARGDRAVLDEPGPLGTREIARLSRGLDRMARELHERSDYIATFAAHVSHELKTPLTAIQGAAELMRDAQASPADAMSADEQIRFLDNILADTGRLTALLGRLRERARADNPDIRGATRLDPVWAELSRGCPGLHVEAEGTGHVVAMSAENAGIVFAHLADNAVRHGASTLRITAQAVGETVVVHVADDGEGIPERHRAQVFESFFTTRREAGGTGMGLGIVRAMLKAHGGTIALLPAAEKGAAFAITLPTTRPS